MHTFHKSLLTAITLAALQASTSVPVENAKLSAAQAKADDLALQAATGDLQSIQDYTIASTEAQLLTQLTVQVRNRAVEAFNDIMRMQV